MQRRWIWSLLVCLWLVLSGCTQTNAQGTSDGILAAYRDRPRLTGKATVVMTVTTAQAGTGNITLELDGTHAPLTAGNFLDLVQRGFYNGLTFHRVVKDPQPFVVQGGDPLGNGTGSFIDPVTSRPRQIPLEIALRGEKVPRYNTLLNVGENLGPNQLALPHRRGALAMARSQAPDSASSQFYIALADLPFLDGRYAVFGYVKEGMNIVDQIAIGDRIQSMTITAGADKLVKP
ncbi:MAG: peptidylprolyl isomerase [Thermostichales cyanobacterium SZTDM-1c_bins_54]